MLDYAQFKYSVMHIWSAAVVAVKEMTLFCTFRKRVILLQNYSLHMDGAAQVLELSELPELEASTSNTAEREREALRARVTALEAQLAELHAMEARQYDFLESGRYSPETFDTRHAVTRERISTAEAALMEARAAVPAPIDYRERVVSLRRAIEALRDGSVPVPDKNRLLRAIVERVSLSTPTPQGDGKGHRLPAEGAFALKITLRL